MPVKNRPCTDEFVVDMKKIYGDVNDIVRGPPSHAEYQAYRELCANLFGRPKQDGGREIPELEGTFKGYLSIGADQRYEIQFIVVGGDFLEWSLPLKYVPKCRIWFVKENDETERLIAMTDVTKMSDDEFEDLNKTVIPRIREEYPHGHFEWQE
jgi:hypothetical protein